MIIATALFAALISAMFVGSVAVTIGEVRRETRDGSLEKRYNIL